MSMIDNHTDCLFVTEHLVKVFEARQLEIQEEILGYESVGQLAVDFTDSQRRLAEKAIEEGIQEMLDARPPAPEGMSSKPTRSRNIDLPEFFAICDVFYDIAPQIRENVLRFEKLFMPAGSYELLPDDKISTENLSDTDSVATRPPNK